MRCSGAEFVVRSVVDVRGRRRAALRWLGGASDLLGCSGIELASYRPLHRHEHEERIPRDDAVA
jgi:hypothetical protein